jgi:hypothetical protein
MGCVFPGKPEAEGTRAAPPWQPGQMPEALATESRILARCHLRRTQGGMGRGIARSLKRRVYGPNPPDVRRSELRR